MIPTLAPLNETPSVQIGQIPRGIDDLARFIREHDYGPLIIMQKSLPVAVLIQPTLYDQIFKSCSWAQDKLALVRTNIWPIRSVGQLMHTAVKEVQLLPIAIWHEKEIIGFLVAHYLYKKIALYLSMPAKLQRVNGNANSNGKQAEMSDARRKLIVHAEITSNDFQTKTYRQLELCKKGPVAITYQARIAAYLLSAELCEQLMREHPELYPKIGIRPDRIRSVRHMNRTTTQTLEELEGGPVALLRKELICALLLPAHDFYDIIEYFKLQEKLKHLLT